jgi:hypothetical protein
MLTNTYKYYIKPDWFNMHISFIVENNVSMLQYLDINNTKEGITVTSSNAMLNNVSSSFSLANGIVIKLDNNRMSTAEMVFYELEASNNEKTGIFIDSVGLPSNMTIFRVNKCVVYRNKERGLDVRANASVRFTECLIQENKHTGVYVYQRNGGEIKLKSSTILQNYIAIDEYYTEEIVLESCLFADRFYWKYYYQSYIYLRRGYRSNFEITIVNSTFNNIVGIKVFIEGYSGGNFYIHLENNTFTGGEKILRIVDAHYYHDYNDIMAYITVKNNIFINNTNMNGQLFEYEISSVGFVSFENNIFEGNMAKQIIRIHGRYGRRSFGDILIHSNQFLLDWATDSIVDVLNYHTITITNNIFKNADVGACCLKAPRFDNVFSINATHNYWGTNSAMEVVDRVCGFEKDMTKSFIYYIPFYTEEDLRVFSKISQDSFNVSGALGGLIINDSTITDVMVAASLLISRSLFVR